VTEIIARTLFTGLLALVLFLSVHLVIAEIKKPDSRNRRANKHTKDNIKLISEIVKAVWGKSGKEKL
jgi:hypothetical protein